MCVITPPLIIRLLCFEVTLYSAYMSPSVSVLNFVLVMIALFHVIF